MIADAEKYKEEEEEISQCMLAKSRLESCAFNYKAEARRGRVDEEHERIVLDKCEQILEWMSANPVSKTDVMSGNIQNIVKEGPIRE